MKKRFLAMIMCVVMMFACVACAKTEKATIETVDGMKLTHKLSEEPAKFTYFAKVRDGYKENNIFNEAFRMTNVLLEPTLSQNVTDMDQALALAVAAKEIPDVIYDWSRENFVKYGLQGALIPLNDLIDKHAPNIKKFLEENPDIAYFCTAGDGNIYFLPMIMAGVTSKGWCIRQDWLDKVNLEVPTNVDEFYNVLKAFKEKDPNGNGIADETPYFGAKSDIEPLLSLFDAKTKFRYKDGKVSFGVMEDSFRDALIEIKKWYDEGLIDAELYTRTDTRTYFCSNNLGGITYDWFGSTLGTNATYSTSINGYDLIAMAPPASESGVQKATERRARMTGEGWAISAMNKNPELTMKYFDFWWTEEGKRLASFGIEGEQYDMVDGKPVVKESVLNNPEVTASALIAYMRFSTNFGFQQDFGYEEQWAPAIALEAMKMYDENNHLPKPEEQPMLAYTDEQEKERKDLKTQIETYVAENVQKWLLVGGNIAEDFDGFRKQLNNLGVERYVEIEQDAYNKYLSVFNK